MPCFCAQVICPTRQFRSVAVSYFLGVTLRHCGPIHQADDLSAANTKVRHDAHKSRLKALVPVRHLIRRDTASDRAIAPLTKSIFQVWFSTMSTTRGTRTPTRFDFLRFLFDWRSAVQVRFNRLWLISGYWGGRRHRTYGSPRACGCVVCMICSRSSRLSALVRPTLR